MGSGRKIAQQLDPSDAHAAMLDDFMDQLMIVLLKRLADKDGNVSIPVAEVDATGSSIVSFNVRDGVFNFEVRNKQ